MENITTNDPVDVSQIIDDAIRICGKTTPDITPEIIQYSKRSLLNTFMELNNRGIPIWTVTDNFLGLQPLKWKYAFPNNIIDIFDLNWRTMSHYQTINTGGTDPIYLSDYQWDTYATTTNSFKLELNGTAYMDYFGICFYGDQTISFSLEASTDNLNWETIKTYREANYNDGDWIWFDFMTPYLGSFLRITIGENQILSLRAFFTGYTLFGREIPVARMNRDDFFAYPSKGILGSPINYYYRKTHNNPYPELQLWQSAGGANVFKWSIHYYQYETINQFISLPNEINVPRWAIDAITWRLASKIAFQLPNIDPNRLTMIKSEATEVINLAEANNSDHSNLNLLGAVIATYTR